MSKLYLGKMNVSNIQKQLLFKGKKGTWMDIAIWVSDEPDKYGNHISIQQSTKQGEDKIYLADAKLYQPKAVQVTDINDVPSDNSDLPF